MFDPEIWRDLPGYEGLYKVSNIGRVLSLKRRASHPRSGTIQVKERIMVGGQTSKNCRMYTLHKNGVQKSWTETALVRSAFSEEESYV